MASCSLHTEFSSLGITTQTQSFISPFPGFLPASLQDLKKKKKILVLSHLLKLSGGLFQFAVNFSFEGQHHSACIISKQVQEDVKSALTEWNLSLLRYFLEKAVWAEVPWICLWEALVPPSGSAACRFVLSHLKPVKKTSSEPPRRRLAGAVLPDHQMLLLEVVSH